MTITGGIGETGGMKGTKDGNNKKAGARFGVPLILLSTAKSYQMGAVKPVKLKWNAVMLSKAGGGLKPSGDFVCFGWHGHNMICGGPVPYARRLHGMFLSTSAGSHCGLQGLLIGRRGGNLHKLGSALLHCNVLCGCLRCGGYEGPGRSSCCKLTMGGGGGGNNGGGKGGGPSYCTEKVGIGCLCMLGFSHDGVASGETNTMPESNLQYRLATNAAVIPSTKVARMIIRTIVHVTRAATMNLE